MAAKLQHVLDQFELTKPEPLAKTTLAHLWRVSQTDGSPAVLKIYTRADRGNEQAGTAYLNANCHRGAVTILAETTNACLMEWLEGPSLGDIARSGDLRRADKLLAETAAHLHRQPVPSVEGLKPLSDEMARLTTLEIGSNASVTLRRNIRLADDLARSLLTSQAPTPLHGDLHHDNVILTPEGPRVFDAKGYSGDPAFELANALRNPRGIANPARIPGEFQSRVRVFASALDVTPERLSQWAAIKCAHSIAIKSSGPLIHDAEADLLDLFLRETVQ